MATTMTTVSSLFKVVYPEKTVENLILKDNPFLQMIAKKSGAGKSYTVPCIYGENAGRSSTLSTAITNVSNVGSVAFSVSTKKDYAIISIDRETWYASKNNQAAFMELLKLESDTQLQNMNNNLAKNLFATTTGSLGTIASTSGLTTTLTLANPDDVYKFYVGQKLQVGLTGALRHAGAEITIQSVNENAGTLGFASSVASSVTGVAVGDYLVASGDHHSFFAGVPSWLPTTAPSSGESFYGVDRSVDSAKLSGRKVDATGLKLTEAITKGVSRMNAVAAPIDLLVLSHANYEKVVNEVSSQQQFINNAPGQIGVPYIECNLFGKKLKMMAERYCSNSEIYLLSSNSWTIRYNGPGLVHVVDEDGAGTRGSTTDVFDVRLASYRALDCKAPGHNCVIHSVT